MSRLAVMGRDAREARQSGVDASAVMRRDAQEGRQSESMPWPRLAVVLAREGRVSRCLVRDRP